MIDRKVVPLRPPVKRPHIPTSSVESSSIKAIGHDPKTRTLRIEFHSGGVYDYPNVGADEHKNLIEAESKGKHFHRFVRGRDFVKLPDAA